MEENLMRVLITGGTGFIGTHLEKRLQDLQAKVEIFDLSNGDDICDFQKVKATARKKFDVIYHLAGFSGSKESNENIEECFKINTIATVNLMKSLAKFSSSSKLVISSSRLEYGRPQYLPVDEKHPTLPISAYGLSKLIATQMALIHHKLNGLKITVFRTSNVYGPHLLSKFSGYNIINHFIDIAKNNGTLTIYGDGEQLRDYIFVDDLVEAFILAGGKNASGEIYNLGFGKGIKLKDMAKMIIKAVGIGRIVYKQWPKDYKEVETGSYISDISKIKRELGFKPKIDFETGDRKTLKLEIRN